jgi:hypothetical protein
MQESTYARHIHYVLFGELEYMYNIYAILLSQYTLFKDKLRQIQALLPKYKY